MVRTRWSTPRHTSRVWITPILHVYARLLLCFMLVLASLVLGFAMFDALGGFVVVRLHPTPMRPCLGVTSWDASLRCRLLRAYLSPFSLHAMIMLTMLICVTCWLSIHLYMFAYMSMHESCLLVCHPCFNTMKLWTFDPNLHLSLVDTTFCLPFCLFVSFLVFLLVYLTYWFPVPFFFLCLSCLCHMLCLSYLSCLFALYPLAHYLRISFFQFLVCWFLIFAFTCTHLERGHLELGHGLPCANKKGAESSM